MNIMLHRVVKTSRDTILFLGLYIVIYLFLGCVQFISDSGDFTILDQMILIVVMVDTYPLKEIRAYQTFGYCRKQAFQYCMIGEIVRAIIYGGIFRTVIQIIFRNGYINLYTEDAPETINQYQSCSVLEMFLVNVAIFFFIRLILVFDSTRKNPVMSRLYMKKKEKKKIYEKERKKEEYFVIRKILRIVEIILWFIVFLVFAGLTFISYDVLLKYTIEEKIGIYMGALAGIILLLFVVWKRFQTRFSREILV